MNHNIKHRKYNKTMSIPIKEIHITKQNSILSKPYWLKIKLPTNYERIQNIKNIIHEKRLHTVCEEASCPNLAECFNQGTATFMILGSVCTRRCPFCDVEHGRPMLPDSNEPTKLAQAVYDMSLKHVVITSVNRDDLHDGGAQHFTDCINSIRVQNPSICIEILVPDFRNCMKKAIQIINSSPPDIFNHNIESVPRLYHQVRPGADYHQSLKLLEHFKTENPTKITKSGIIVGMGETNEEIINVMCDLYNHGVSMITIGQYLQPSAHHLPVKRYVEPKEFDDMQKKAIDIGFLYAACGPLVRSSYHADWQINGIQVK